MVKNKIIYLNKKKSKYCVVRLYKEKKDMQKAYDKFGPDKDHPILGCHCPFWQYKVTPDNKMILQPRTGVVFLCFAHCGTGIVSHELLHAVLWAYKHVARKKQYPFIIKNMKEEETILHNLTFALIQFYKWYWKIEKYFK